MITNHPRSSLPRACRLCLAGFRSVDKRCRQRRRRDPGANHAPASAECERQCAAQNAAAASAAARAPVSSAATNAAAGSAATGLNANATTRASRRARPTGSRSAPMPPAGFRDREHDTAETVAQIQSAAFARRDDMTADIQARSTPRPRPWPARGENHPGG